MTSWGTITSASGKAVSQEEMIAEKILRWCEEEKRRSVVGTQEEKRKGGEGGERVEVRDAGGKKRKESEKKKKRGREREYLLRVFKPLRISDMVST